MNFSSILTRRTRNVKICDLRSGDFGTSDFKTNDLETSSFRTSSFRISNLKICTPKLSIYMISLSKLILFWLFIISNAVSISQAHESNSDAVIEDLSENLTQCYNRVKTRDQEIHILKEQIRNFKTKGTIDQEIAASYATWQTTANALIKKQERILNQSKQIETKFSENMQLCQTSVNELKTELIAINKLYNDAVKNCLKPWYLRWEFWLGGMIGFAIGIPI